MLRALLWDVDGTLAETEEQGHRIAFNEAFAAARLPWHWDPTVYRGLLAITGGKERLRAWWQQIDPAGAAAPGVTHRIALLHADKTRRYVARVAAGRIGLRPGVQRLLLQARAAGLRQAIATTTTADNVEALLAATLGGPDGLSPAGLFDCIGAGDVVAHKKPAPDVYQWVLQRLGLQADECLAIEDSAPGVAAALAAGLPVLVTRSAYTAGDALPPVLADLDGLGEASAPARGCWAGQAWQGVVDIEQLRALHARPPWHPLQRGRALPPA